MKIKVRREVVKCINCKREKYIVLLKIPHTEQFTEDVRSYLESFGEADRRLAEGVQGGV